MNLAAFPLISKLYTAWRAISLICCWMSDMKIRTLLWTWVSSLAVHMHCQSHLFLTCCFTVEKTNIRFMHLLQEKDVAEEIDVFYTPAYAAGDVVADSLISNVLLSQTYYKPDIVSIIKTLCGMPGPLYDGSAAHLLSSSPEFSTVSSAAMHAPHLTSIPLPPEFINRSFACLFETLLLDHGTLPLGLLRAADENLGNELPFVYTNPVPSLILKETDRVYILSSPNWTFTAS